MDISIDSILEIKGVVGTSGTIGGIVASEIMPIFGMINPTSSISACVNYGNPYDVPSYTGSYDITPKTSTQILDTEYKLMEDDITVKSIPYYETDNESGTTIYIAGEI